jgi:hypothetical protein
MRRIIMAVGLILALASPALADTTRCTTREDAQAQRWHTDIVRAHKGIRPRGAGRRLEKRRDRGNDFRQRGLTRGLCARWVLPLFPSTAAISPRILTLLVS